MGIGHTRSLHDLPDVLGTHPAGEKELDSVIPSAEWLANARFAIDDWGGAVTATGEPDAIRTRIDHRIQSPRKVLGQFPIEVEANWAGLSRGLKGLESSNVDAAVRREIAEDEPVLSALFRLSLPSS